MSQAQRTVLLVCGSTRKGSLNGALLDVAQGLAPKGLKLVRDTHLASLPLYSQDLDTATPPPQVTAFRDAIRAAEGIVVASPEYNHGMASPLKNALDWASRPYGTPPLAGKCCVAWTATPGAGFGFQALAATLTMLHDLGNFVISAPRMVLQRAGEKLAVDAQGKATLQDPVATAIVQAHLDALQEAIVAGAGPLARRGVALFAERQRALSAG